MSDIFGNRLKDLRIDKDMSLKSLSEYLGIGVATLSNYERSERKPDFDTIIKIADYFNVSVDYLLGRTDAKNPNHHMLDNLVKDFNTMPINRQTMMAILLANVSSGFETNHVFYNDETLDELCKMYEEIWMMQVFISTKIFTYSHEDQLNLNSNHLDIFKMYNERKLSLIERVDDWFEKCYATVYGDTQNEE